MLSFSGLQLIFDFRWVTEIIDTIGRDSNEKQCLPNMYFDEELEQPFITILSRITLWSNVMVAKFNSNRYCASSAESENYFKRLKSDPGEIFYSGI